MDILALRYLCNNVVYLFKCDWWDVDIVGRGIIIDGHTITVNIPNRWYTDDPFILVDQGRQVFFLANPMMGGSWRVIEGITNMNVYDRPLVLNETLMNDENSRPDAYQEEKSFKLFVDFRGFKMLLLCREDVEIEVHIALKVGRDRRNVPSDSDETAFSKILSQELCA